MKGLLLILLFACSTKQTTTEAATTDETTLGECSVEDVGTTSSNDQTPTDAEQDEYNTCDNTDDVETTTPTTTSSQSQDQASQ